MSTPTTYYINVPGSDDVDMIVGDTLDITFVEACRFCSPDDASTYFSPALPNGKHAKDDTWSGIAQTAGSDKTVDHHSVGEAVECSSSRKRSGTRSIQIGSGTP
jgi:hypothetical protein